MANVATREQHKPYAFARLEPQALRPDTPRCLFTMLEPVRFLWIATRGHRLRPWRSPYLRWRLETYSGLHADRICARDFLRFLLSERGQLLRFTKWLTEMRTYTTGRKDARHHR